ncbi:MAG TPA: glycerol kinase, partial [Polyangia bacterium]|nr:glycerol kinase [Polyangia bacterium]
MPLPGIGLLALLAFAPPGAPASVPVRVEFEAPAGCSDAEAFFSGVLSRASHVRRARPGEA